jgi:hypothetical protein
MSKQILQLAISCTLLDSTGGALARQRLAASINVGCAASVPACERALSQEILLRSASSMSRAKCSASAALAAASLERSTVATLSRRVQL